VSGVTELDDRWVLGWDGLTVQEIRIGYRLVLLLGDGDVELVVETAAAVSTGAETWTVVPESGDVAAALPLLRTRVLAAVAFKSGALRVEFSNDRRLDVMPDRDFEAWIASGPAAAKWISQPGGGLAVWL
jgi:hypothetical protein